MPANSLPRRAFKRILAPVLNERTYRIVQGLAMGWDIRTGGWTEPELDIIRYAVKPGDTVVDIGANYGLWSYHLSRAVGPTGKVYAFEPLPFTSSTFRFIAKLLRFQEVHLVPKACGDTAGRVTFTVPISDSGSIIAGIVHESRRDDNRQGRERHARYEKTKDVKCDQIVLDEYLDGVTNVSFIKCDVEGADYFAMKGAKSILEKNLPTVIVEINPWFLEGFGVSLSDLVNLFVGLGYRLYHYENGRLQSAKIEDIVEDNWVFVHPSREQQMLPLFSRAPTPKTVD